MLKVKKMVDQEIGESVLDSNPYFSPIFCGYLRNNDHIRKGKINLTLLGEKKENENQ